MNPQQEYYRRRCFPDDIELFTNHYHQLEPDWPGPETLELPRDESGEYTAESMKIRTKQFAFYAATVTIAEYAWHKALARYCLTWARL